MRILSKILFLALLTFQVAISPVSALAQADGINTQINRLDVQIAQAAAENNTAAVSGLQRDRSNWLAFKRAIESEDASQIMALQNALQHAYDYQPGNGTVMPLDPQTEGGPEFYNQVYLTDGKGGYTPLEKNEVVNSSSGAGYGGFGGRTNSVKIPGSSST